MLKHHPFSFFMQVYNVTLNDTYQVYCTSNSAHIAVALARYVLEKHNIREKIITLTADTMFKVDEDITGNFIDASGKYLIDTPQVLIKGNFAHIPIERILLIDDFLKNN